jgi:protein-disulfide isomerase
MIGPIKFVHSFILAMILTVPTGLAIAQTTRVVAAPMLASILAAPLPTPPTGDALGNVTIVEYFDYDCPVCRHLEPELRKPLESDAKVRLIRKDWPVFGEASEYAAYCSYAAAREGRYSTAHDALISSRRDLDSKEDVRSVLQAAGFSIPQLDADIRSHAKEYADLLKRSRSETSVLGLQGTPGLIVGDELMLGGADFAGIEKLVRHARTPAQRN